MLESCAKYKLLEELSRLRCISGSKGMVSETLYQNCICFCCRVNQCIFYSCMLYFYYRYLVIDSVEPYIQSGVECVVTQCLA